MMTTMVDWMISSRGGQATFDQMGWHDFAALLKRNRRACSVDPAQCAAVVEPRYNDVTAALRRNREEFSALDSAIDRIVWQLVGVQDDGSLP